MKIYTRTGDGGDTGLQGGLRISKAHPRIAAYGAVDEANAVIGTAVAGMPAGPVREALAGIQPDLFVVGADLSNPNLHDARNRVGPGMARAAEDLIDRAGEGLPELASFVLPGGTPAAAGIHHARAVIRRAEAAAVLLAESEEINPHCISYLNRLSDLLFVLARAANAAGGVPDVPWVPGKDKI